MLTATMVSAHPNAAANTLDSGSPRHTPKLGDFFSPYQQQQHQQFDISSSNNNGYENNNFSQEVVHRHSVTSGLSSPLRQQNHQNIIQSNINNALARQSPPNSRPQFLNANQQQFKNPLQPLMSSPPTGFVNQENPQMLQNRSNSSNSIPKNPKLYKTELCRSWMDTGRCNYGERCQYAHGDNEKRCVPRHPKYKTEACSSYHKTGYCPYGPRCHFVHNEDPAVLRQLIAQNSVAMATVGSEQSSPTTQRPRNLSLQQTMSAPPSTAVTPMQQQQQQCHRQFSNILPIGSRPQYFSPKQQLGSDGESPIPSSTDSGSESPMGSFSPGLEESLGHLSPTSFRRSLSQTNSAAAGAIGARWSPTSQGMPNFPANSGAAVAGNNGLFGSDPWNAIDSSTLINSLSSLSFNNASNEGSSENPWESNKVIPARLPVFERLSNNS